MNGRVVRAPLREASLGRVGVPPTWESGHLAPFLATEHPAPPVTEPLRRQGVGCGRVPRRSFTLVEMLVVATLIGLLALLIAPRFGRVSPGMLRRQAETAVRDTFRDAAARAAASGVTVRLTLDREANRFTVEREAGDPVAAPAPSASAARPSSFSSSRADPEDAPANLEEPPIIHSLPDGIVWEQLSDSREAGAGGSEKIVFRFHPNGEAGGGPAEFTAGNIRYRLAVDRLTGRAILTEAKP